MVDSATAAAAATSAKNTVAAAKKSTTVDYDQFLTLLVAQMKNQDPTEPMKANEYMAQLASFSNVEQSVQIRETLDTMLKQSYVEQAGSIIGKTITSADGETSGTVKSVKVYSDGIIATLTDGKQMMVGAGVSISE